MNTATIAMQRLIDRLWHRHGVTVLVTLQPKAYVATTGELTATASTPYRAVRELARLLEEQ